MKKFKDFLNEVDEYSIKDWTNTIGKIKGVTIMGSQDKYGRSVDFMKNDNTYSIATNDSYSSMKGNYVISHLNTNSGEVTHIEGFENIDDAFKAISKI